MRAADTHRPGRDVHARFGATRRRQRRWQPAQVGKSRLKTNKPDQILHRGVQLHDLLFTEAAVLRHHPEIRSGLAAVDDRNGQRARLRLDREALLPPALQTVYRLPRHLLRAAEHHSDIVHAGNGVNHFLMVRQTLG